MHFILRYYGKLTAIAGCEQEEITLKNCHHAKELEKYLVDRYPAISTIPVLLAANNQLLRDFDEIKEGLIIDCMPPFSGG